MNTSYEEKFLDYLEGRLSAEENAAFERALETDADLRESLQAYRHVLEAEQILAEESYTLGSHFSVQVMDRIESEVMCPWWRFGLSRRAWYASVASCACLVLVVLAGLDVDDSAYRCLRWFSQRKYRDLHS